MTPLPRRAFGLPAMLGVALLLRLAVGLPQAELPRINDMGVYTELALALLEGGEYRSTLEPHFRSLRAPGYPIFLAGVFALFGPGALPVVVLQSLLGAATCGLVARIGEHCFDARIGRCAGWICVFDPELIHWTPKLLTETLFTALLAAAVLLGLRAAASRRTAPLLGLGLVLGLAVLVRPNVLLFLPFVAVHLVLSRPEPLRRRVAMALLPLAIAGAMLSPWTLRNHRLHDEIVPVSTIGGLALYVSIPDLVRAGRDHGDIGDVALLVQGAHELPNGYDMVPELFRWGRPPLPPGGIDEIEQSRRGRELYLEYVRSRPLDYLRFVALKASLTFSPVPKHFNVALGEGYGVGRFEPWASLYAGVFALSVFALGAYGLVRTVHLRSPSFLPAGALAAAVAQQLAFLPQHRYFLPALAIGAVFVAAGIARAWHDPRGERAPLATAAALLILGNAVVQIAFLQPEAARDLWQRAAAVELFVSRGGTLPGAEAGSASPRAGWQRPAG